MGIVGGSKNGFGHEAAGIVRRTGPNVTSLKAGDRVMLLSDGAFTTTQVLSEDLCAKVPDRLSFEDAATMPCVFATSIYSIFSIGNSRRGEVSFSFSVCTH